MSSNNRISKHKSCSEHPLQIITQPLFPPLGNLQLQTECSYKKFWSRTNKTNYPTVLPNWIRESFIWKLKGKQTWAWGIRFENLSSPTTNFNADDIVLISHYRELAVTETTINSFLRFTNFKPVSYAEVACEVCRIQNALQYLHVTWFHKYRVSLS